VRNGDPLPDGWDWETAPGGEIYFIHPDKVTTTWNDPRPAAKAAAAAAKGKKGKLTSAEKEAKQREKNAERRAINERKETRRLGRVAREASIATARATKKAETNAKRAAAKAAKEAEKASKAPKGAKTPRAVPAVSKEIREKGRAAIKELKETMKARKDVIAAAKLTSREEVDEEFAELKAEGEKVPETGKEHLIVLRAHGFHLPVDDHVHLKKHYGDDRTDEINAALDDQAEEMDDCDRCELAMYRSNL
jgi:hypothetical protein